MPTGPRLPTGPRAAGALDPRQQARAPGQAQPGQPVNITSLAEYHGYNVAMQNNINNGGGYSHQQHNGHAVPSGPAGHAVPLGPASSAANNTMSGSAGVLTPAEPEDPAIVERRRRIRQWEIDGIRRWQPPSHIVELQKAFESAKRDCEALEKDDAKRQRLKRTAVAAWRLAEYDWKREVYKTELAEASLLSIINAVI